MITEQKCCRTTEIVKLLKQDGEFCWTCSVISEVWESMVWSYGRFWWLMKLDYKLWNFLSFGSFLMSKCDLSKSFIKKQEEPHMYAKIGNTQSKGIYCGWCYLNLFQFILITDLNFSRFSVFSAMHCFQGYISLVGAVPFWITNQTPTEQILQFLTS